MSKRIQFRIDAINFTSNQKIYDGVFLPEGYRISIDGGVELLKGSKVIPVCRRPVAISEKFFDTESKKFKVVLSYINRKGKWKSIPLVPISFTTSSRKIVELSDYGFPVTSSNAVALVNFLDTLNSENDIGFQTTYTVSRCGWHRFNGIDYFIDPRINCSTSDDEKKVNTKIDSQSLFAKSLRSVGDFNSRFVFPSHDLCQRHPVQRPCSRF